MSSRYHPCPFSHSPFYFRSNVYLSLSSKSVRSALCSFHSMRCCVGRALSPRDSREYSFESMIEICTTVFCTLDIFHPSFLLVVHMKVHMLSNAVFRGSSRILACRRSRFILTQVFQTFQRQKECIKDSKVSYGSYSRIKTFCKSKKSIVSS